LQPAAVLPFRAFSTAAGASDDCVCSTVSADCACSAAPVEQPEKEKVSAKSRDKSISDFFMEILLSEFRAGRSVHHKRNVQISIPAAQFVDEFFFVRVLFNFDDIADFKQAPRSEVMIFLSWTTGVIFAGCRQSVRKVQNFRYSNLQQLLDVLCFPVFSQFRRIISRAKRMPATAA
jgi:hypothetical protein